MTPANLRSTLLGTSIAFAAVVAYVALLPGGGVAHGLGLGVVLAVGVVCLVRLTFAVSHPQMTRYSDLPPDGEGFYAAVHEVLEELPDTLRRPVDAGLVRVRVLTAGRPAAPIAAVVRPARAERPWLVVRRDADERDVAPAVREALAHGLTLEELEVPQLDR